MASCLGQKRVHINALKDQVKEWTIQYIIVHMQILVKNKALDAIDEHKSNLEDNTVSKKVHMYSMFQTYCTYFL